MALRIKRDDMVLVISGRYKGASGRVLAVYPGKNMALVEGVNVVKKHQKARSQQEQGGIMEREAPIQMSKLMLTEPGGRGRAARWRVDRDEQGNKVRVLKLKGEGKEVVL
jgi:large subunit ribosomal protein L24